jgi:hypothetical protein
MRMRLVKVKKRVFKREFLEFKLVVVVFDIYEMSQEEDQTVIEVNKVFWVFPATSDTEIELENPKVV